MCSVCSRRSRGNTGSGQTLGPFANQKFFFWGGRDFLCICQFGSLVVRSITFLAESHNSAMFFPGPCFLSCGWVFSHFLSHSCILPSGMVEENKKFLADSTLLLGGSFLVATSVLFSWISIFFVFVNFDKTQDLYRNMAANKVTCWSCKVGRHRVWLGTADKKIFLVLQAEIAHEAGAGVDFGDAPNIAHLYTIHSTRCCVVRWHARQNQRWHFSVSRRYMTPMPAAIPSLITSWVTPELGNWSAGTFPPTRKLACRCKTRPPPHPPFYPQIKMAWGLSSHA